MQLNLFDVEASEDSVLGSCKNIIAACASMHNPHVMPILQSLEYVMHTPLKRIPANIRSYAIDVRENIGCVVHAYSEDSVVLRDGSQVVAYAMRFESLMNSLIHFTERKYGWLFPPLDSPFRVSLVKAYLAKVKTRLRVDPESTI
jgi:hypothetical protein